MDPSVKLRSPDSVPGPFRVGDRVRFLWGVTPVEGIVIEDRGFRGVAGKRWYRVRARLDDVSDPLENEYPFDELTLVARAPRRSRKRRDENLPDGNGTAERDVR